MNAFKVLDKLRVGNTYCVTIEGDMQLLKKGQKLSDEKGNMYEVETVGMSHYQNIEDYKKRAEIVLGGDVENMGDTLFL